MSETGYTAQGDAAQTVLEILGALARLDDAGLHAVAVRAQTLLLDRPAQGRGAPALQVEVVEREELRLLASYRALAPAGRWRLRQALRRAA